MIFGEYSDIVKNDILTMQRFLDVSRFLYSGGWQVCIRQVDHYSLANFSGSLVIYINKKKHQKETRQKFKLVEGLSTTDVTGEWLLCCTWDRLFSRLWCRQRRTDLGPYCNIEVLNAKGAREM